MSLSFTPSSSSNSSYFDSKWETESQTTWSNRNRFGNRATGLFHNVNNNKYNISARTNLSRYLFFNPVYAEEVHRHHSTRNSDSDRGTVVTVLDDDEFHEIDNEVAEQIQRYSPGLRNPTAKKVLKVTNTHIYHELIAGVLAGSMQVLFFNPYDRALYLSMIHQRPFFDKRNWGSIFDIGKGVWANLIQRIITYGMYYPIEQMCLRILLPEDPTPERTLMAAPLAGQMTGAINGIVTNPLAQVKFRQYDRTKSQMNNTFVKDMHNVWSSKNAFTRGLLATCIRDSIFGCTFTTTRTVFASNENQFIVHAVAGSLAAILSGPMNYVRNYQYSQMAKGDYSPIRVIVSGLRDDLNSKSGINFWKALNQRLCIGWGSLRVGLGMAAGHHFYQTSVNILDKCFY